MFIFVFSLFVEEIIPKFTAMGQSTPAKNLAK